MRQPENTSTGMASSQTQVKLISKLHQKLSVLIYQLILFKILSKVQPRPGAVAHAYGPKILRRLTEEQILKLGMLEPKS